MRSGLAGVVGALILAWPTGAGLAEAPPPLELPMPAPETAFASSPPHSPEEATAPVVMPVSPNGPRILAYGYDPGQGILTFTVHDDPSPLIWEAYTGPGRPPDWFTRCWSRVWKVCGH